VNAGAPEGNQFLFPGSGSVYDKWNTSLVICDTYSIAVNKVMVAIVKRENYQISKYC
jgi:hypothetical protein